MTPILTVRNLSTGYGKKQVLFNVSLDVMPGEILLITGGNGSGKPSPRDAEGSGRQYTLLKAIYGPHLCSMKITEDAIRHIVKQSISEQEMSQNGLPSYG